MTGGIAAAASFPRWVYEGARGRVHAGWATTRVDEGWSSMGSWVGTTWVAPPQGLFIGLRA